MCQTCRLARAEKISPRKHRLYDDNVMRPFEVISTDIKGPLMESRGGMRYSVVFIDQFSRYAKTYYMKRKSETPIKLREYLTWVRSRGWYVGVIRCDRGSEYFGSEHGDHLKHDSGKTLVEFEKIAETWGCRVEAAPKAGSTGNGIEEEAHSALHRILSRDTGVIAPIPL